MTAEKSIVLVVDDDESLLRALRRLIAAAGFNVRTFACPRDLLAAEIPVSNACFVMDVNLPEMNGVELLSKLEALGHGLPAIVITGRNDAETQSLLRKSDAVAILWKPVDATLLLDAIERALMHSRTI